MPVEPNSHSESEVKPGEHSGIPHPPPHDNPKHEKAVQKPIPDTGWRGQPEIPSQEGGDREKGFMNKPPYWWKSEGNKFQAHYTSRCWCGNVVFEFHGNPVDAKHCHCRQCQQLHGAPFQWAVIFPKTSARLVENKDDSLHFFSTELRTEGHHVPCKVSCNVCRSPLFDEGRNTVLAYPSSFQFPRDEEGHLQIPLDFQPTAHIFYGSRVMEVPDGVPKWEGHKHRSKLLQELSDKPGMMPKYKGMKKDGEES